MYRINRRLWITTYLVAFAVMIWLSWSYGTGWAWGTWAALFGLFVVLTDPAPRLYERDPRKDLYDVVCDCPRCMRCTCDDPNCDDVTHDEVAPEGERDGW
jgi:hypothetical protein